MKKSPKPTQAVKKVKGFGILNKFGGFWTPNTFSEISEAKQYMKDFWGKNPNPPSMEHHKIVPVITTYKLPRPHKR